MGAGRHASLAAALLAALLARPAAACLGDCSGDGVVSVAELMTGVRAGLGRAGTSECAAWDPDGDGTVHVADLVRGVAAALHGCPADPTPTPTLHPDPVGRVFDRVCPTALFVRQTTLEPTRAALRCELPGHYGELHLEAYPSLAAAASAFTAASAVGAPYAFHDLPAVYWEVPFYIPALGGADRFLVWQLGCWVIGAHSFDDTTYRLAPQVVPVSEQLLAEAGEALLARCPPEPSLTPTASATPTATPTPTATRSDLFAAVAAPFEASCSPFGIIGYEAVDETADGFSLFCRPTAGHEHRTTLRRHATAEAATAAFEAARGGLAPLSLDAVRAAYGERPFHVGGRACGGLDCGLVREMVWQLDCWVAEMRSADDTHFILTTDPVFLTGELLASAAAHLRAACGSGGQ